MLCVLGKFLAEVCSVKIPQYDEQGVWMFFLRLLLGQPGVVTPPYTGLRWNVNTDQDEQGELPQRIK